MYRPFHLAALLLAMLAMVISVSAAQDQSPLSQYPDCAVSISTLPHLNNEQRLVQAVFQVLENNY
jgi:hypothetical protein